MVVDSDSGSSSDDDVSIGSGSGGLPTGTLKPKNQLYLRFPIKFNVDRDKAIADIHQIHQKIRKVRLPRQKSARFCLVDFDSKEDMVAAMECLKEHKINEKSLIVKKANSTQKNIVQAKDAKVQERRLVKSVIQGLAAKIIEYSKTNVRRDVTNVVFIQSLPTAVKIPEIAAQFPDQMDVHRFPDKKSNTANMFVVLPSPADALRATKSKVIVRGESYKVELARSKPKKSAVPKKKIGRFFEMQLPTKKEEGDDDDDDEVSDNDDDDDDDESMKVYN